jgi:hypothetical protein
MFLKKQKVGSVLCATANNEGPWLLEWISYHRAIGFDGIIIVSNNNTDGSDKLLDRLDECGLIKHIRNDLKPGQVFCQEHAYNLIKESRDFGNYKWGCVLDLDEFLVLAKHDSINSFLKDYEDLNMITLNWLMFSSSGQEKKEDGLVIERFTDCNPDWRLEFPTSIGYKSIFKVSAVEKLWAHSPTLKRRWRYLDKLRKNGKRLMFPNRISPEIIDKKFLDPKFKDYSIAYINHYIVKSREESLLKMERFKRFFPDKKKSKMSKNTDGFFQHYEPKCGGTYNDTILKRCDDVKAEMAKMIEECDLNDILKSIDKLYKEFVKSLSEN